VFDTSVEQDAAARRRALGGIACMTAGGLLVVVSDAINKWLTASYPIGELIFLRMVFVLPLIALLVWLRRENPFLVRAPALQLLRGGLMVAVHLLFVAGLALIPLAEAVALTFAAPLFMTALAGPLLGEQVGWRRWLAVALGGIGVLVALRPLSVELFHWAALLPLAAALAGALKDIVTRPISTKDSSVATLMATTLIVAGATALTAPFGWCLPAAQDLVMFAFGGLVLGLAHYLLIEAFRLAEVAVAAPFIYTQLVWSVLLGFFIWHEVPDIWVIVGALILTASGFYLVRRGTATTVSDDRPAVAPRRSL
jgi:drug/metabolite transporter (DMT)-like permease